MLICTRLGNIMGYIICIKKILYVCRQTVCFFRNGTFEHRPWSCRWWGTDSVWCGKRWDALGKFREIRVVPKITSCLGMHRNYMSVQGQLFSSKGWRVRHKTWREGGVDWYGCKKGVTSTKITTLSHKKSWFTFRIPAELYETDRFPPAGSCKVEGYFIFHMMPTHTLYA